MNQDILKKQIEILRLRQQATRLALSLFEAAVTQSDVDDINQWVNLCTHADSEVDINRAIEALRLLADLKNLPTDL